MDRAGRLRRRDHVTFRDRVEAGRLLGERLRDLLLDDAVVLGLPRGGVVVAAEVAAALGAPLDIVVARKLGVPWQPELAFGAVAPGAIALREDVIAATGIDRAAIDAAAARESAVLPELERRYRGDVPAVPLHGRTAVIVDDGLAPGAPATAAVRSARRQDPKRIVVAVPVCAGQTANELRREVDDVICLGEYDDFHAVGMYYQDFAAVPDATVRELIARSRHAPLGR
jgi:predicted phosphoribosyltransferase